YRGEGDEPLRQDQSPGDDRSEDREQRERQTGRDLPAEAARPVPRDATGGDRALLRERAVGDQVDRHGRRGGEGGPRRRAVPAENGAGRGKGIGGAVVGPPEGRLPARPDPGEW